MATAADIINDALASLGVIEEGQTGNSAQLAKGLEKLNDLIDSLNADKLTLFQEYEEIFTLTSASQYTIGASQTFNTTRPERLISALFKQTSTSTRFPIQIATKEEWDSIGYLTTTGFPEVLWYDEAYPTGTINIWPQYSGFLVLTSMRQITEFVTTATTFSLPPGYRKMLKTNLAVDLAPAVQSQIPPSIQEAAKKSLGSVKRKNIKNPQSLLEVSFLNRHKTDIYQG